MQDSRESAAALEAQQRKLESLDPRFKVLAKATEAMTHFQLLAREEVEFTLSFRGDKEKVGALQYDLIDRGLPADLKMDLQTRGVGNNSRKKSTLVVDKKQNGGDPE